MTALTEQLSALGLRRGGVCMVHASFKSLCLPRERITDIIDTLCQALGPDGTLIMPTHTGYGGVFDPDRSPSTTGALTEVFRTRYPSLRSEHPTHRCHAMGRCAAACLQDHQQGYAVGAGSPCEFLHQQGGQVLLIGVDLTTATVLHLAEFYAHVPYLRTRSRRVALPNGEVATVELSRQPGHSNGFVKIEPHLRQAGAIRYGTVAAAHCRLIEAKLTVDIAVALLRDDPAFLLCDEPDCTQCSESRRMVMAAGSA